MKKISTYIYSILGLYLVFATFAYQFGLDSYTSKRVYQIIVLMILSFLFLLKHFLQENEVVFISKKVTHLFIFLFSVGFLSLFLSQSVSFASIEIIHFSVFFFLPLY